MPSPKRAEEYRFSGRIAGLGTASGVRLVVGLWDRSPLGRFADVMVEHGDGHRMLLAPSPAVADFVAATYSFDEILLVPVDWTEQRAAGTTEIEVTAGPLRLVFAVGGPTLLGRLLGLVPRRLAVAPWWSTAIDPLARVMLRGVRTAGSAGRGRREFYGVTGARRIVAALAEWSGDGLGALTRVQPPVRFGFGSTPAAPQIVDIVTTVRTPIA